MTRLADIKKVTQHDYPFRRESRNEMLPYCVSKSSDAVDDGSDEFGAEEVPNWSAHLSAAVRRWAIEQRFIRLRDEWKSRKSHSACVEDAILHPAYLRIIGMGSDAIPFILAELEREIDHWFCALYAITEADPVPEENRGNMKKMVAAWIEWGKMKGHKW